MRQGLDPRQEALKQAVPTPAPAGPGAAVAPKPAPAAARPPAPTIRGPQPRVLLPMDPAQRQATLVAFAEMVQQSPKVKQAVARINQVALQPPGTQSSELRSQVEADLAVVATALHGLQAHNEHQLAPDVAVSKEQHEIQPRVLSAEVEANKAGVACALLCAVPAERWEEFQEKWQQSPQKNKVGVKELSRDATDSEFNDANFKFVRLEFRDESAQSLSLNVESVLKNTFGANFDPELQDLLNELQEEKIEKRLEKQKEAMLGHDKSLYESGPGIEAY